MKTLTTQRGISYDLEVVEYSNYLKTCTVKFEATCENGSKYFWVDYNFNYNGCELNDNEFNDLVDDTDLTDIEQWVDETDIGWAVGEIQKYCIRKSELGKYYSFSCFTFNTFSIVINCMESYKLHINGKTISSEQLKGLEQVNDFLALNK